MKYQREKCDYFQTRNQIGAKKMLLNGQKVPGFLFIGFDDIHANHLDKIRIYKTFNDKNLFYYLISTII